MYGFADYYDPTGEEREWGHGIPRPAGPRPAQATFTPLTGQAAGRQPRGEEPPQVIPLPAWAKPVVNARPAAPLAAPPSPPAVPTGRPPMTSYKPPSSGSSRRPQSSGVTGQPQQDQQPFSIFAQQPVQPMGAARNFADAASFGSAMHFGQQADAIKSVNDATSNATRQWHDANQRGADRDQQMALSHNAMNTALQMKQMEVNRDREKYGVLSGLLSGFKRIR